MSWICECGGKVGRFKRPLENPFWMCVLCRQVYMLAPHVMAMLAKTVSAKSNAGTVDANLDSDQEWFQTHLA